MAHQPGSKKKSGIKQSRVFRGVRDPLVGDASNLAPIALPFTADASGNASYQLILSPLGVTGPQLQMPSSTSAGTPIAIVPGLIQRPLLPWLYNQSRGFERYRITRARLIFVSNMGSTATGRILMDSTTDYADATTGVTVGTNTGGKVFDLASGAAREFSFNLDIDSTWKKVSNQTFVVASATIMAVTSSINDLQFSTIIVAAIGTSASSGATIGSFFLDYDVEFKDPIAYGVNA